MIAGPATIDGGAAAIREAWETGRRPTAILAMSDAIAIGAMQALRQLGLHVPDDVSVVGFDDIDLASHVDPPLTTVHQPIDRKGEEAVRALLAVIEGAGAVRVEHRRLDTRSGRPRLDGTGPAPRSHVTVDTPAWVRDAVFYQIFPDRFAGSARVPKPGALEPWDAPPTVHGFKGGDLLGIVEKLDYLQISGSPRST